MEKKVLLDLGTELLGVFLTNESPTEVRTKQTPVLFARPRQRQRLRLRLTATHAPISRAPNLCPRPEPGPELGTRAMRWQVEDIGTGTRYKDFPIDQEIMNPMTSCVTSLLLGRLCNSIHIS